MEVSINEEGQPTTYLDSDDSCFFCKNQYGCPLIECINRGIVQMDEPIIITECKMFENL